ncbi:MAG: tRNA glutamyl-Q(34) synthetase GluQRS [Pseudomonadota bacterium]
MCTQAVFRFAPSPTGYLHLGHALSAIIGFELAQRLSGRFLVRIEDTDNSRTRQHFVDAILEDLAWLGLEWEEPVWRQSERLDIYAEHRDRLRDVGLLYPCFATRAEIAAATRNTQLPSDPDGAPVYPGLCRGLSAYEISRRMAQDLPYALRLDMAKAIDVAKQKQHANQITLMQFAFDGNRRKMKLDPARWGDVIIARKDTGTSYHLAGVVDDAAQGVSHVCRGQDLEAVTDIHRLLQILLDLPAPVYHHHALVRDADGRKLSKSSGDTALYQLRRDGWTAAGVRQYLRGILNSYGINF